MSYKDYLKSKHWKDLRIEYLNTDLPKKCLVCDNPNFQLHHRSYTRLGKERILDLIPLCGCCHKKIHDYIKLHNSKIQATHKVIRKVFGWTRSKTNSKFRKFSLSNRGFRWSPIKIAP